MDWRDHGILLSVRRHGETSAIIEVFTEGHGRHAGVVRGGTSRKAAPVLQPGTQLDVEWRARLEDHIGTFRVEPLPRAHRYWSHPRVTVTPHVAAETRLRTSSEVIAENVRRAEAGESLLHLVDRNAGY